MGADKDCFKIRLQFFAQELIFTKKIAAQSEFSRGGFAWFFHPCKEVEFTKHRFYVPSKLFCWVDYNLSKSEN